jgi:hypothetical protein
MTVSGIIETNAGSAAPLRCFTSSMAASNAPLNLATSVAVKLPEKWAKPKVS